MEFRFLLVGCGMRGQTWDTVIGAISGCTMAGYVDTQVSNARALGGLRGKPAFEDVGQALGEIGADAIVLATPPGSHAALLRQLVEYGTPILAEKPLADTLESAVEIVERAERLKVPLAVSMQFRYLPANREMRRILREGALGPPGGAQLTYIRDRDPYGGNLNWGTRYPATQRHPMLLDLTVHHFDLVRFCYGVEVAWLEASTWNPPGSKYAHDASVAGLLGMVDGMRLQYFGTFAAGWDEPHFEWRTDCANGVVVQRGLFGGLWMGRRGERVLGAIPLEPCVPMVDDSRLLVAEFMEGIRGSGIVPCSGREHLEALALVFAAIEASETGRRVNLAEFRAQHRIGGHGRGE